MHASSLIRAFAWFSSLWYIVFQVHYYFTVILLMAHIFLMLSVNTCWDRSWFLKCKVTPFSSMWWNLCKHSQFVWVRLHSMPWYNFLKEIDACASEMAFIFVKLWVYGILFATIVNFNNYFDWNELFDSPKCLSANNQFIYVINRSQ